MTASVHIRTWGCQMNDLDTAKMRVLLEGEGFRWTDRLDDADVVLLNTCSVREKPTHKVRSFLGEIAPLKRRRPELVIGLAGCYAQQEKGRLLKKFRDLDLVMGPDAIPRVPELVREAQTRRNRVLDIRFHGRQDYPFVNDLVVSPGQVSAFVTIQKGCDNVCSFCVVPKTRGRQVSRPALAVVEECRSLAERGLREVTLLGQNVNSYGLDNGEMPFHELIEAIAQRVPGLERIRFTTSNPWDLSDGLVEAFGRVPKLAPYLHLPLQSGSDRVLELMRRNHTVERYLEIVEALRAARPEMAFSTDIICGHPGETEADHRATLALLERVRYSFIFSFCYSPRPRTESARMEDSVPDEVKKRRLAEVQLAQKEITRRYLSEQVGRVVEVLVEGSSRRDERWRAGRTPQNTMVNFPGGPRWNGRLMEVRVDAASLATLRGSALEEAPRLPVLDGAPCP
jgi:tRNA-2-methylthio-N6-dimethylallyladenosine synthase